jgi:hypothetical protein
MTERPTRRGFLAACSAAAAALGLTARAAPARPPIPGGIECVDPNNHARVPRTWCTQTVDSKTGINSITVTHGGSNYTEIPVVVLNGGSGATAKAWVATS